MRICATSGNQNLQVPHHLMVPPNDVFFQDYLDTYISVQPVGAYSLHFNIFHGRRNTHPYLAILYVPEELRRRAHQLAKTPELLKHCGNIIEVQGR